MPDFAQALSFKTHEDFRNFLSNTSATKSLPDIKTNTPE
jgi:hypothetical protein